MIYVQFFAQAGFPCPALRNPSDHFLRCINSDFDKVKATLKGSMKLRVVILNSFLLILTQIFWSFTFLFLYISFKSEKILDFESALSLRNIFG